MAASRRRRLPLAGEANGGVTWRITADSGVSQKDGAGEKAGEPGAEGASPSPGGRSRHGEEEATSPENGKLSRKRRSAITSARYRAAAAAWRRHLKSWKENTNDNIGEHGRNIARSA